MIKRIINPAELKKVASDIFVLFEKENREMAHQCGILMSEESIVNNLGNNVLLNWDVFVWANLNEDKKYDAVIVFVNEKNIKFNLNIFSEFVWLSKNPRVGFKLFQEAVAFARENKFKYITVNSVEKHPLSKRNERFYKKMGFLKDSTTFIAEL